MAVRQFSAVGHLHRAKQDHLKDKLLCNSHKKLVLQLLKRHDGTRHDDDVCVLSRCFPGTPLSPLIRAADLFIHTGSVSQYYASDTTSSGVSEPEQHFTPRCSERFPQRWRTGAGSPHPNGTVNGASVSDPVAFK